MPRFADVVRGRLALSPTYDVDLHHALDEDGKPIRLSFRVRVLSPLEVSGVLSAARNHAKAQGVDNPEVGEPIYEEALRVEAIAIACVDTDSKEGQEPIPYFESADEVRRSRKLTSDTVHFIHDLYELWNDQSSLQKNALFDKAVFERTIEEAAGGNLRPFFELRRGAQSSCFAFTANELVTLRRAKSPSSSISDASTKHPQDRPEGRPVQEEAPDDPNDDAGAHPAD